MKIRDILTEAESDMTEGTDEDQEPESLTYKDLFKQPDPNAKPKQPEELHLHNWDEYWKLRNKKQPQKDVAEDSLEEDPRVAANASEILSAVDDGKNITVTVRTPSGEKRRISNSNPAVVQRWLNLKYGLRLPHSIARRFAGLEVAEDQADNPDSWESQEADAERNAETARMYAQDAAAGGLAERKLGKKITKKTTEDSFWGMMPEKKGYKK